MKQKLIELAVQRGRLLERSAMQRELLRQQLQPVGGAMRTADRVMATVRNGADYLVGHPGAVASAAVAVILIRPSRIWRWSKRGLLVWSAWRKLRAMGVSLNLGGASGWFRSPRRENSPP